LTLKTAELAWAVPQVVAHRVTRMAMAGSKPSARDQKEFKLMVAEKNAAFIESWTAMATQAMVANQAMALSFFRPFWFLTGKRGPTAASVTAQVQRATMGVLNKGLTPVHRKAVANAKRLSGTRLR